MKIVFTQKKKKAEIPVFGACEVKLYAVPTSYSDDGYFAAVWATHDLEPVPACAGDAATLLAHVSVVQDENGDYVIQERFRVEGVTYAKS